MRDHTVFLTEYGVMSGKCICCFLCFNETIGKCVCCFLCLNEVDQIKTENQQRLQQILIDR